MIRNSELFYAKARDFQDERARLTSSYERQLKSLERFAGSAGYDEDVEKLTATHEAALKALREKYRPELQSILAAMLDAVDRRTVTAPTAEQLNLLTALQMQKKPSLDMLQRAAETVKDNPVALAVVSDIARQHGYPQSFRSLCPEMGSDEAASLIQGMQTGVLDDFLNHDTTRLSRTVRDFYNNEYGGRGEPTPLKKRPLFENRESCFHEMWGFDSDTLQRFSAIVDA